jgi:type VI secretion system Hcp family effector
MFLKIDDIPGESPREGVEDQIEIEDFRWEESQPGGAKTGKGVTQNGVKMSDFVFVAPVSKASPKLMVNCATGKTLPTAEFVCRKAVGDKQDIYLKYTFTNFMVSNYQMVVGSDGAPRDNFSLNFEKIEMEYKPQAEGGGLDAAVTSGFSLKTMAAT